MFQLTCMNILGPCVKHNLNSTLHMAAWVNYHKQVIWMDSGLAVCSAIVYIRSYVHLWTAALHLVSYKTLLVDYFLKHVALTLSNWLSFFANVSWCLATISGKWNNLTRELQRCRLPLDDLLDYPWQTNSEIWKPISVSLAGKLNIWGLDFTFYPEHLFSSASQYPISIFFT